MSALLNKKNLTIAAIVLIVTIGIAIYFVFKSDPVITPQVQNQPQANPQIDTAELVKKMSANENDQPSMSEKEQAEVLKKSSAPKNAKPSLSQSEMDKVLQSMTAQ